METRQKVNAVPASTPARLGTSTLSDTHTFSVLPAVRKEFIDAISWVIWSTENHPRSKQWIEHILQEKPIPISFYVDKNSSTLPSVESYINHLIDKMDLNEANLVAIYIYLQRYFINVQQRFNVEDCLNSLNAHTLLFLAAVIVCKFDHDESLNNEDTAPIGGFPLKELNRLEVEFIDILNYELLTSVNLESMNAYYDTLSTEGKYSKKLPGLAAKMAEEFCGLLRDESLISLNPWKSLGEEQLSPLIKKISLQATPHSSWSEIPLLLSFGSEEIISEYLEKVYYVAFLDHIKTNIQNDSSYVCQIGTAKLFDLLEKRREFLTSTGITFITFPNVMMNNVESDDEDELDAVTPSQEIQNAVCSSSTATINAALDISLPFPPSLSVRNINEDVSMEPAESPSTPFSKIEADSHDMSDVEITIVSRYIK